ncbi:putative bifunctional diguanylate cyclase/phosphodiesterase [Haloimpatiens sp. FM7330]|uniref:putative bifunctional diguanylate cyclase/phosphodiesterase n=1 Tax=Haloimpatiens sp. FM7330 TaxID=3298610 RepID=UPI00362CF4B5
MLYFMIKKSEKNLEKSYNELSKAYEKIQNLAYYDHLTKLPNRLFFTNQLKHELEKNHRGTVLFLDLDDFKKINDSLGHNYGDMLLKKISNNLKQYVNQGDVIARFGGDEFLILLPEVIHHTEAANIAQTILNMFNSKFKIGKKQVYISASIGIIIYPTEGDNVNLIIKNADTAMYKAKFLGKNRYCFFDKNLSNDISRKIEIENGLRTALSRGELDIYYQPQVDLKSGKIRGAEALLRWNSETLGKISPYEFIPISEQTGIIHNIFKWVLKSVCIQKKKWENKGYNFNTISINISSIQLQQQDLMKTVKNILQETNTNPEFLQFEITESVLMKNLHDNIQLLKEFKKMGLKIALDDFGTGYSSLNYLRKLPIDTVKIDKSFIDDITTSLEAKDITDGIIHLAHKIKLEVVAEGVEYKDQSELLKDMNCDMIQGYYFYKPLSIDTLEKTMQN